MDAPSAAADQCGWNIKAGWVMDENQKKGDRTWNKGIPFRLSADFSRRKKVDRIEGYLSSTSLMCGENTTLTLVGAESAKVTFFRMGYYGGSGARKVRTLTASNNFQFSPNAKMIPGQYLLRLDAPKRKSSFIPLVVRSDSYISDATFISSVLTWQTYNQWGGSSFYKGEDGKQETQVDSVSFDRPYDGDGSGQLQYMELPIIKLAEQIGLTLNYATDLDLDRNQKLLDKTNSIILGGHSEYWTEKMRSALYRSVADGKNLFVLGGNTGYNKIEISGRKIIKVDSWRNVGRDESLLLGSQYIGLGYKENLITLTNKWPFSKLGKGAIIQGIYGNEVDTPVDFPGPAVETIARGSASNIFSTYYSHPSGAGVLNLGTNGWVCALEDKCPWGHRFGESTRAQLRAVTEEILRESRREKLGNWRLAFTSIKARA